MAAPVESSIATHAARREALRDALGGLSALLFAGEAPSRNYPANRYPFRASSHFLHLVGAPIERAVLLLGPEGDTLYVPRPEPEDALWHGESPSRESLRERLGIEVRWLEALTGDASLGPVAMLPPSSAAERELRSSVLGHSTPDAVDAPRASEGDRRLARALVDCRLRHDAHAVAELRRAADATTAAHCLGMATTRPGRTTSDVRAAMESVFVARGMTTAYGSIVTPRGEVLHAPPEHRVLRHGDLLLCDVGAEAASGYAADVTRTFPVTGRFDGFARDLYRAVLRAQREAIHACRSGTRYRVVHLIATRSLGCSLIELGLLHGDVEERVADGSVALFFPHGVGHLLGLDVHDMEDLGDLAGYGEGRSRGHDAGLRFLRLDRDLEPGMAVTIEPGVYFVPAILDDPSLRESHRGRVDFALVDAVRELGGIRIEDDILVTDEEPEVLTRRAPKEVSDVERWVGAGLEAYAWLGLEGP